MPLPESTTETRVNVADRLATHAAERPDAIAVAAPDRGGWRTITFAEIDADATRLARGLVAMGVRPGHRMALLVRPSVEFVTLVFALLRSGATMVLVDAGLGRKNIVRCLESTAPDGFVAIPQGQVLRVLVRKRFPHAKLNVTVGRRWFWGGQTLDSLRRLGKQESPSPAGRGINGLPTTTAADDPAAIVFTSGSTGPPKGVVYRHETFTTQCEQIQKQYDLQPGKIDLACFPLFGLFNVACGVTTVLPEMDFSRPASCDPKKLFAAANEWKVSQSFASPAVWDRLSRHAEETGESIPTLKQVFSCGAPVPAPVIRRTLKMVHPDAELHTPYGATEALPVATIEAQEILAETATKTDEGAGVCVGRRFAGVEWRIIRITDDPIATIDVTEELPPGEIGELIVRAPQVSHNYLETKEPEASAPGAPHTPIHNQQAKIQDGTTVWHRMGDVGYFDEQQRFWYCGRKSQRVVTSEGTLYTECVEGVVNSIQGVARSALVGIGASRKQDPKLVVESEFDMDLALEWMEDGILGMKDGKPISGEESYKWLVESHIQRELEEKSVTQVLAPALMHPKLPTDIRHNSKIRREELAEWAAKQLKAE